MVSEHLLTANSHGVKNEDMQTNWLNWCRLCAKQGLTDQDCSSIFVQNEDGKFGSELATSIGKYFWVNIKADDEISQCLCLECRQLIEELVTFTERVNKVQALFCLLQNMKPTTTEEANDLRKQCGLIDEEWQHIVKPHTTDVQEISKPLLIDQQIQTDFITSMENEEQNDEMQICTELEDVSDVQKSHFESREEMEAESVYEYVTQEDNEIEFLESNTYITSYNENCEDKQNTIEVTEDEDDMQDSDLFKELKYKTDEDEDSERKQEKTTFEIITEDENIEVEYHESEPSLQQEEVHSVEMLEEDEEFLNVSENESVAQTGSLELQKSKRGRPFGAKNSQTYISNYRFDCKECKRSYKNPNIFRKHMSSSHNTCVDDLPDFKEKSNICTVCSKQCVTSSSLKIHMRLHLPDEEKYNVPCPYCDRKFSQVGAMRQHVNGIHHQMKPFICDQCGRACKTMAALTEHQLVHTNECPFECEFCHKRFKNKPRLKTHMDIHNKSNYKCAHCGLVLNTRRTLLQHQLVHSDDKPLKCEFCDAAFKRTKTLKNHLLLHAGLRPYKCNFCNKSFSNGSNCRAHKKRTHPRELAEEEASGIGPERVPIPKIEELKSGKGILVQPRRIERHSGGLSNNLRKHLNTSESRKQKNSNYYESTESPAFEVCKSEVDETESMVDNPTEQCEETVIYEIIDEI